MPAFFSSKASCICSIYKPTDFFPSFPTARAVGRQWQTAATADSARGEHGTARQRGCRYQPLRYCHVPATSAVHLDSLELQFLLGKNCIYWNIEMSYLVLFSGWISVVHTDEIYWRPGRPVLCALFPLAWEQVENWRPGHLHSPRNELALDYFFPPLSYADSSHNIKAEKFIYYVKTIFSLLIPAFLGLHCLAVST